MSEFNWHSEKAALRATLNACIRQGFTYEQTKQALEAEFAGACNACCIARLGQIACLSNKTCYIEQALATYLRVAKEKLENKAEIL